MSDKIRNDIHTLIFYALCPNGKRIRVEKLGEEFEKDKNEGYALRTFDNRLVIVVEAVFPGEEIYNGSLSVMVDYTPEKIYWHQAFYLSTGMNSDKPNTWLPFSGIVMDKFNLERGKNLEKGRSWFSKYEYSSDYFSYWIGYKENLPKLTPNQQRKLTELENTYGWLYLPEGNMLRSTYHNPFDRWGCPSYVLASHALGGDYFRERKTEEELFAFGYAKPAKIFAHFKDKEEYQRIIEKVNTPSPLQPCFLEMQKIYPPTKINVINRYIDENKAIPIMNAFRDIGVFPPGLSFIQIPVQHLNYSIPISDYYHMLIRLVYEFWILYKLKMISQEGIQKVFSDPQKLLKKFIRLKRKNVIFPNEPEHIFTLNTQRIPAKNVPFFGGTRKKRVKKNKTRKH